MFLYPKHIRAPRLVASASKQWRLYSASASPQRPTIYSLFKTPTTKSIILTVAFGSIATDLARRRSELEAFQTSQTIKDNVLEQVVHKLEAGENVDIHRELKIANAATRYKYSKVTEIEIDNELEQFLKMSEEAADEPHRPSIATSESTPSSQSIEPVSPSKPVNSTKFL